MESEHFFPFRRIKIPIKHFKKDLNPARAHQVQFLNFEWETFDEYELSVSLPYFIYRLSFMIIFIGFFIFAVIYSDPSPKFYLIYLTNWTFTLITLYGILSFINCALAWTKIKNEPKAGNSETNSLNFDPAPSVKIEPAPDNNSRSISLQLDVNLLESHQKYQDIAQIKYKLNWLQVIIWLSFSMIFVFSFIVSFGFWFFLYPEILKAENTTQSNDENAEFNEDVIFFRHLIVHGFNALCLCIETLITAIPLHITHQVYSLVFGIIYLLFTLIYDKSNGKYPFEKEPYIYHFLDWRKPENVIPVPFIAMFAIFMIYLFSMLLYSTRLFLVSKYLKPVNEVYRFHLYDYESELVEAPKTNTRI